MTNMQARNAYLAYCQKAMDKLRDVAMEGKGKHGHPFQEVGNNILTLAYTRME
jgi:hypothetical protein